MCLQVTPSVPPYSIPVLHIPDPCIHYVQGIQLPIKKEDRADLQPHLTAFGGGGDSPRHFWRGDFWSWMGTRPGTLALGPRVP